MSAPPSARPTSGGAVSDEAALLAAARAQLPSVQGRHYFNAGRHGPIPLRTHAAVEREARVELEAGRGSTEARDVERSLGAVRRRVETLLHAPAGSVALTHNASEGVNIALTGIRWRAGEEVLTFTTEHPSALIPLETAVLRHDVVVRRLEPSSDAEQLLAQVAGAIGPRTRMVSISHLSWATGAAVPLREIADACHARGALLVADGAQSAGSMPIDVVALDADFYAIPGQKWLCGPSGTGALHVRPELVAELLPGVVGWGSIEDLDPVTGAYRWLPDARRFEGSSESVPLRVGLGESLRWMSEDLGLEWIHTRIREGAARLRGMLSEVDGVSLVTPRDSASGLLCFTVAGLDADQVVFRLLRRKVVVRTVMHPRCVRACVGFYNDEDDLLALRDAVAAVARDAAAGTHTEDEG